MEKEIKNAVSSVVGALYFPKVYSATKYVSETMVVRISRKRFDKKLPRANQNIEAMLVIGRPNYAQRKFIKSCKKAGEPFPVKKVQLKMVK